MTFINTVLDVLTRKTNFAAVVAAQFNGIARSILAGTASMAIGYLSQRQAQCMLEAIGSISNNNPLQIEHHLLLALRSRALMGPTRRRKKIDDYRSEWNKIVEDIKKETNYILRKERMQIQETILYNELYTLLLGFSSEQIEKLALSLELLIHSEFALPQPSIESGICIVDLLSILKRMLWSMRSTAK